MQLSNNGRMVEKKVMKSMKRTMHLNKQSYIKKVYIFENPKLIMILFPFRQLEY